MKLAIKKIKAAVLVVVLATVLMPAVDIYAATGKTTIAVSSDEIKVGESVTVTIKAKTDGGNTAKAKLKLSYDEDILEFVSCSETHEGGSGGSVTATGSSVTVKFKAIAAGRCPLSVSASNGVVASSGNSLSSVEGCSTNIDVEEGTGSSSGRLSADNSLRYLTISEGILSPEFAGNVVNYTATVPGDVTEVEIEAETANDDATIESVSGNTDLQVGENTIRIVVKAENGALATYTIELTREEPEEIPSETEAGTESEYVEEKDTTNEELEEVLAQNEYLSNSYKQLEEKYQREKDFSRSVIYILIIIIAILIVLIINIIVFCFKKADDDFEDSFESEKPVLKSKAKVTEKPVAKPMTKPVAKPSETKKEERVLKETVRKNFEVVDFNDED